VEVLLRFRSTGWRHWAHNSAGLHMVRSEELAIVRRAFAKQVLASVSVRDQRLEEAFAGVERERYLGPGPWPILRSAGYVFTPNADPVYLYCDVLIGIVPERGLNNGMPSYHAPLIASLVLREGEHVVHVGTGTGYYTAIMAHLVGSTGRVTAIEFDPALAQRAEQNFSVTANVHVLEGDGAQLPFDSADAIYVNAGATRPADNWLARLNDGGRLILPLTAKKTLSMGTTGTIARHGAVFRVERKGGEYLAKWISAVGVYPCEGGRDDVSEAALNAALQKGGWDKVTRLYRTDDVPDDRCWLRAPGWSLAYD
jgi:protein-L-isoaspartate(D-aspartate) O-methyltransferase